MDVPKSIGLGEVHPMVASSPLYGIAAVLDQVLGHPHRSRQIGRVVCSTLGRVQQLSNAPTCKRTH